MGRAKIASWAMALAIASGGGAAWAQASPTDVATAQALFDEGKRLMQEKRYAEACPKLAESQRLDPAGGTILVLALCHEMEGKIATAWAEFLVAQSEAKKDRRSDRETMAGQHAKKLQDAMPRMRIVVASPIEGMEITRSGAAIPRPQWGTPIPVDPGEYPFEARAPGRKPWKTTLVFRGDGRVTDIVPPNLEPLPEAAVGPAVVSPSAETEAPSSPPPPKVAETAPNPPPPPTSVRRDFTWPIVAGSVGGVGLVLGTAFGLGASSKWNDAKKACPNGVCKSQADLKLESDAKRAADLSTVSFVVGVAGLATAAVLYFVNPTSSEAPSAEAAARKSWQVSPYVSAEGWGVGVGGAL